MAKRITNSRGQSLNVSGVRVTGLKELGKRLAKLEELAQTHLLTPALVKAARPMADDIARRAPDDPETAPPYDLKTSIRWGERQRSGPARQDKPLGRFEARVFVGPNKYGYPQAMMQEFGTRDHAAQPYMRPAWDAGKQQALATITVTYKRELDASLSALGV